MGKPVVTYFDILGRGEAIRVAMILSGIEFKDKRVTIEQWAAIKAKSPAETLPTLEIDGEKFSQSTACLLYIAKKGGLLPKDPIAAARVTEVLFAVEDIFVLTSNVITASEQLKAVAISRLLDHTETWVPNMDSMVEANGSPGFTVGSTLTVADIAIYCLMEVFKKGFFSFMPTILLDEAQALQTVYRCLNRHPKVLKWNRAHFQGA